MCIRECECLVMWEDWSEKQENFLLWRKKGRKKRDQRSWSVFRREFLKMLPVLRSSAVILDVGCARGAFLKEVVNKCGCYGVGIDPHPYGSGFPVVKAVAEYLPFRKGCFDLIYTTSSLDHFQNPQLFVSEVDLLLLENGNFMVMQSVEDEDNINNDPTHLRSFSESSLLDLFCRFNVVTKKYVFSLEWLLPNWICNFISPIYGATVLIILMSKKR